jgi:hypothetical protein
MSECLHSRDTNNALILACRLQTAFPQLADVFNREVNITLIGMTRPLTIRQDTPLANQPQPESAADRQRLFSDGKRQSKKFKATANALLDKKTCKFTWSRQDHLTTSWRKVAISKKTYTSFAVSGGRWSVRGTVSGKYGYYWKDGMWGMKFTAEDDATCYKHPASPKAHAEIETDVAQLKEAYKTDLE